MNEEGKWNFLIVFFFILNFDFNVFFMVFLWFLLYFGVNIICSDIVFEYFVCIKALINEIGYSYIVGGIYGIWIIKFSKKNTYDCIVCSNGCDHSSTNAPDFIKFRS